MYKLKKRRRVPTGVPKLNSDANATPRSVMIDGHYAINRVLGRWVLEPNRFRRLLAFLNMNAYEAASMIGMEHARMERLEEGQGESGRWDFNGTECILLSEVERFFMGQFTDDVLEVVIPAHLLVHRNPT